eukprot:2952699-Prymnesium_polylepis.1
MGNGTEWDNGPTECVHQCVNTFNVRYERRPAAFRGYVDATADTFLPTGYVCERSSDRKMRSHAASRPMT